MRDVLRTKVRPIASPTFVGVQGTKKNPPSLRSRSRWLEKWSLGPYANDCGEMASTKGAALLTQFVKWISCRAAARKAVKAPKAVAMKATATATFAREHRGPIHR